MIERSTGMEIWRLTVVVGISAEQIAEYLSVAGCVAGPHIPDLVT